MSLQASWVKKTFQFAFKARTSRGLMQDKISWFLKIWDEQNPETIGIGECGPLPGLSIDDRLDFEQVISDVVRKIPLTRQPAKAAYQIADEVVPKEFPAITFGIETALFDLSNGGRRIIFDNTFKNGVPIPINGLIWMGEPEFMRQQIDQKLAQGFRCIKLKVGGLDFDAECEVIQYIRQRYAGKEITIRLDANGAFAVEDVFSRIRELAKFDIHSIEQPIKPNLPEMEELCRTSPIPIAFDEELIGKETREAKLTMLKHKPDFIILKPTLHGGLSGCKEWIELANSVGISWWITSALESSIGLNAICQFTANYPISIPQGLGTGTIYIDNIASPLTIANGNIFLNHEQLWDLEPLIINH